MDYKHSSISFLELPPPYFPARQVENGKPSKPPKQLTSPVKNQMFYIIFNDLLNGPFDPANSSSVSSKSSKHSGIAHSRSPLPLYQTYLQAEVHIPEDVRSTALRHVFGTSNVDGDCQNALDQLLSELGPLSMEDREFNSYYFSRLNQTSHTKWAELARIRLGKIYRIVVPRPVQRQGSLWSY